MTKQIFFDVVVVVAVVVVHIVYWYDKIRLSYRHFVAKRVPFCYVEILYSSHFSFSLSLPLSFGFEHEQQPASAQFDLKLNIFFAQNYTCQQ